VIPKDVFCQSGSIILRRHRILFFFLQSKLYTKLTTPGFSDGHVIFGDNAYVSTEYMVTPYKNVRAGVKDDFNFFHSQLQINIEHAFGMLVKKWAILQKPLPCQMGPTKQLALIMALCQLHNFLFWGRWPTGTLWQCSGQF
jgi:hypothetical protein